MNKVEPRPPWNSTLFTLIHPYSLFSRTTSSILKRMNKVEPKPPWSSTSFHLIHPYSPFSRTTSSILKRINKEDNESEWSLSLLKSRHHLPLLIGSSVRVLASSPMKCSKSGQYKKCHL